MATTTSITSSIKGIALIASLPLFLFTLKQSLEPLYASLPVTTHLSNITLLSSLLSSFIPLPSTHPLWNEPSLLFLTSTLLSLAPKSTFVVGSWTARWHDVLWGPIVTHTLITAPIVFLHVLLLRTYITRTIPNPPQALAVPLVAWIFVQLTEGLVGQNVPMGMRLPVDAVLSSDLLFIGLATLFATLALPTLLISLVTSSAPTPPPNSPKSKDSKPKSSLKSPHRSPLSTLPSLLLPALSLSSLALTTRQTLTPRNFPILSDDGGHRLLASSVGASGRITVGENIKDNYRYLRAGHSLLGGLWTGPKAHPASSKNPKSRKEAINLGDSIYSAFVLQEGALLFEREFPADEDWSKKENKVLVIGLGAGIVPRSFFHHGLRPTILELDSEVYKYARDYFGLDRLSLPEDPQSLPGGGGVGNDGEVYIGDARQWITQRANITREEGSKGGKGGAKFDYVIHDVFSGGSVPGHLFTVEFWRDVRELMRDDGILAVNFAGEVGSNASKAILTTLLSIFSPQDGTSKGRCKAYHDAHEPIFTPPPPTAPSSESFINMVFFCTPTSNADGKGMETRKVRYSDVKESPLREWVLGSFDKREVDFKYILGSSGSETATEGSETGSEKSEGGKAGEKEKKGGKEKGGVGDEEFVLRDGWNRLGEWQVESGLEHWKLMRMVMPDEFWESY
ncbi:hypothetical protein SISSUDRAFT_1050166 [Sistotremastrum suecicum HHB10207 ss-3]|uniref:S-adenosyl-L-methionine-dependent methyltransferase n=1 Tax=Sistotremastrum suecicum HHB10207 ss-3 TaxID=1314776 RepID=A0A166BCS9_9AGAM|nr:hypothetical protein SISSUDRAFT_1050166 [Sistotremastrum suecicum HHB10207 ss-3]